MTLAATWYLLVAIYFLWIVACTGLLLLAAAAVIRAVRRKSNSKVSPWWEWR